MEEVSRIFAHVDRDLPAEDMVFLAEWIMAGGGRIELSQDDPVLKEWRSRGARARLPGAVDQP